MALLVQKKNSKNPRTQAFLDFGQVHRNPIFLFYILGRFRIVLCLLDNVTKSILGQCLYKVASFCFVLQVVSMIVTVVFVCCALLSYVPFFLPEFKCADKRAGHFCQILPM